MAGKNTGSTIAMGLKYGVYTATPKLQQMTQPEK